MNCSLLMLSFPEKTNKQTKKKHRNNYVNCYLGGRIGDDEMLFFLDPFSKYFNSWLTLA